MTLADRIVVLRAGRVEQVGSPLELYDDPDNSFVAGFIGSPSMNFLRATMHPNGRLTLPDFDDAHVPLNLAVPPAPGANLTLGIRPEQFHAGGLVTLSIRVDMIEHLGSNSFAYARSGTDRPLVVEFRDRQSLRSSATVQVSFNPKFAFLFDSISGARLR